MKISHSELEACARNPQQWYVSKMSAQSHGYNIGYDRILRLALFHFHKASANDARKYLESMVKKHHLKNVSRIAQIERDLESYIKWTVTEALKVAGTQVNIVHPLGFLELRGQVGRVDVIAPGYRAILFGEAPTNWQAQLRLPLIQTAVALMYGRPQEMTAVGFQMPNGTGPQAVTYSPAQIATAERNFRALGSVVQRLAKPK